MIHRVPMIALALTLSTATFAQGPEKKGRAPIKKGEDSKSEAKKEDAPPFNGWALLAPGLLLDSKKPFEQVFPFAIEKGRLKLDRSKWASDTPPNQFGGFPPSAAENILREIQRNARSRSSSSSVGPNFRQYRFSGGEMNGNVDIQSDRIHVSLSENNGAKRALEIGDDSSGFSFQVSHPDGHFCRFQQFANGRFLVVAAKGERTFAGQAESFVEFLKKHRPEAEEFLLPIADGYGLQLLLTPSDPAVQRIVAAKLSQTPAVIEEGKKLLDLLDSGDFRQREEATKKLNRNYSTLQSTIRDRLESKGISLEMKTRLRRIIDDNASAEKAFVTARILELEKDAGYVVSLLDSVESDQKSAVLQSLRTLTGQDFGDNVQAWRDYAKKSAKDRAK